MKSGRGGIRIPGKGKKLGRPPTGRKERITIQPTKENLEWLREQEQSNSAVINKLIDEVKK